MEGGYFIMQKCTTIIGVLTMLNNGYSYRMIQSRYSLGNSTITSIKRKFEDMVITLDELKLKDEQTIENLFYGNSHTRKDRPLPDFRVIYEKLTDRKSKTNLYFEWLEYKKTYPDDGYGYSQFNFHFRKWLSENNLEDNLSMAVNRIPGEVCYIDWIGDTLPLVLNSETGEMTTAHFFVTTLGVSSYCFAMAFPNEKTDSFLVGTVEAIKFYGAVPKILKPDNTKAAVTKNTKDELVLNEVYEDIQSFYGTVIVPAPARKPKGKPSVENHVRWLETHLLEKLKGRIFPSFKDLNTEIQVIVDELNSRPFQKGKGNRKQMFEEYDKPSMKPLPKDSFTLYSYAIRKVPSNYHLEFDGHYYSVPFSYYRQEVTLKASFYDIKICDQTNRLICRHERAYKPFPKYITKEEHMPKSHQYYFTENKYDGEAYKKWAKGIGEPMYIFICRLIAGYAYEPQAYKSCNAVLQLCKDAPKAYVNKVAQDCLDLNVITYSCFKTRLNNMNKDRQQNSDKLPQHKNIRGKENYQ